MEPFETYEHRGMRVELHYDDSGFDWGDIGDMLGTRVSWHRDGYGDREPTDQEIDALHRGGLPMLRRYLRRTANVKHVLLLAMLDHSGVTVWTTEDLRAEHRFDPGGWDSGVFGFIYADPEQIEMTGALDDSILDQLRDEVKEWDDIMTGNVYGYVVTDHEGDKHSCWGFIGSDLTDLKREAELEAEALADIRDKAAAEALRLSYCYAR